MRTPVALALALSAAGCGQTGALYLPEDVATPVEIRGPAATGTAAGEKDEEKDAQAAPPPGR